MRMRVAIVVGLVVGAGLCGASAKAIAQEPAGDQAEIRQLFAQRVESFNAHDLKRQLALFTEDARYYSSTGKLSVVGHEDLGLLLLAAWSGPMQATKLGEEVARIDFLSATGETVRGAGASDAHAPSPLMAIVDFEITFQPAEGEPERLRGVRVLVKQDGAWRIRVSCQTPYDEEATLTPERFAEIKERFRAEYNRQLGIDRP